MKRLKIRDFDHLFSIHLLKRLLKRYFLGKFLAKLNAVGSTTKSTPTNLRVSILIRNGRAAALNIALFYCLFVQKINFFFSKTNKKFNI
jgi:hypothetical protein